MVGQRLQINHLCTPGQRRLQNMRLGKPGAPPQNDKIEALGQAVETIKHLFAIAFIPTVDEIGLPPDLAENPGHRAAALPTTPAIDKRAEIAVGILQGGADMPGNIARHKGGASAFRGKGLICLYIVPISARWSLSRTGRLTAPGR